MCTQHDFALVYPHAAARTSCPAFVNSGLYMGDPNTILDMVQVTTGKVVDDKFTAILESIQGHDADGEVKALNDQTRVSVWYSLNQHRAVLDRQASLFRNLYFGMINATESNGFYSCGYNGIQSCGLFDPPFSGHVDDDSLEIVMDPVPGCATAHAKPLFIRGNGHSKGLLYVLAWQRQEAFKQKKKKTNG